MPCCLVFASRVRLSRVVADGMAAARAALVFVVGVSLMVAMVGEVVADAFELCCCLVSSFFLSTSSSRSPAHYILYTLSRPREVGAGDPPEAVTIDRATAVHRVGRSTVLDDWSD